MNPILELGLWYFMGIFNFVLGCIVWWDEDHSSWFTKPGAVFFWLHALYCFARVWSK